MRREMFITALPFIIAQDKKARSVGKKLLNIIVVYISFFHFSIVLDFQ